MWSAVNSSREAIPAVASGVFGSPSGVDRFTTQLLRSDIVRSEGEVQGDEREEKVK